MVTAYGGGDDGADDGGVRGGRVRGGTVRGGTGPTPDDVVAYLRWCQRSRPRRG
jgi:hypothetical protein